MREAGRVPHRSASDGATYHTPARHLARLPSRTRATWVKNTTTPPHGPPARPTHGDRSVLTVSPLLALLGSVPSQEYVGTPLTLHPHLSTG